MNKPWGHDWMQIYSIYGTDEWQTVAFLISHSFLFTLISLLLIYFAPFLLTLISIYITPLRFAAGFVGSALSLSSLCLIFARRQRPPLLPLPPLAHGPTHARRHPQLVRRRPQLAWLRPRDPRDTPAANSTRMQLSNNHCDKPAGVRRRRSGF